MRTVPVTLQRPAMGAVAALVIMSHAGTWRATGYVVLSIEHRYSHSKQTTFNMRRAAATLILAALFSLVTMGRR